MEIATTGRREGRDRGGGEGPWGRGGTVGEGRDRGGGEGPWGRGGTVGEGRDRGGGEGPWGRGGTVGEGRGRGGGEGGGGEVGPGYTTQAGSTILFWNVFSVCEFQKLFVTNLMPNSSIMNRNVF